MLAGRNENQCASAIVCNSSPGIGICQAEMGANNYPGFNVQESLERCVHSGRDIKDCAGNISCTGFKKICFARLEEDKYPGATEEEALQLCQQAGRNYDMCKRNINCE